MSAMRRTVRRSRSTLLRGVSIGLPLTKYVQDAKGHIFNFLKSNNSAARFSIGFQIPFTLIFVCIFSLCTLFMCIMTQSWVVKSRRMRWAGHVARMGEGRGLHRVLFGKPEGKRPLGRPRRRWKDNIKMDL